MLLPNLLINPDFSNSSKDFTTVFLLSLVLLIISGFPAEGRRRERWEEALGRAAGPHGPVPGRPPPKNQEPPGRTIRPGAPNDLTMREASKAGCRSGGKRLAWLAPSLGPAESSVRARLRSTRPFRSLGPLLKHAACQPPRLGKPLRSR